MEELIDERIAYWKDALANYKDYREGKKWAIQTIIYELELIKNSAKTKEI